MASVNKVQLIGRLGKAPELRYTSTSAAVCIFSLATHEVWRDKSGEKQESLEWHNITVWGKVGENCHKYLTKGSLVYLEGSIKTDTYDKNGVKMYTTKIVARDVKFLDTKSKEQEPKIKELPGKFPKKPPEDVSLEDIPF